ncbi:MAG: glycosyl hydrolase, partial [Kiritimatiellales bacterium]
YIRFDDLRVGDFDKLVAAEVAASHVAPKPVPILLDPESAGPVTQGILNLGKFYKISRPPLGDFADRCTNKWTDGTLLTDGESQTGLSFVKEQYVGWQGSSPVTVVFDLGRLQGLETVCVRSVYNTASNFAWPKEVRIRTSADRNGSWVDWKTITQSLPLVEGPQVITGSGSSTQALEVEVTLSPDSSSTNNLMLASEIELSGSMKNSWREVPTNGVYHGAYSPAYGFDTALLGGRTDVMRLDLFEWMVGKPLSMTLWYQGMEPGRNFQEIQEFRRRYLSENFYGHRIMTYGWLPTEAVSVTNIATGKYDDFFEQYFLDSIDPVVRMGNNEPVWFRPMNEFNTTWTSWGQQPAEFCKAWRRIYNIAEKVGAAQKHLFIWGPNHLSYPDEAWNKMEKYWPGDQYVDWVGISCYPPSTNFVAIESNRYPIARFKEVYSKYGNYKPLMVTEGAFTDGVDKARWVDEWFQVPIVYPNVRAFIWENHNDRSIQSNVAALILYREKVQNTKWISTTYAE